MALTMTVVEHLREIAETQAALWAENAAAHRLLRDINETQTKAIVALAERVARLEAR